MLLTKKILPSRLFCKCSRACRTCKRSSGLRCSGPCRRERLPGKEPNQGAQRGAQSWGSSLGAAGGKGAGKESGHPDRCGSRRPGREQGRCERGRGEMASQAAHRLQRASSSQGEWPLAAHARGDQPRLRLCCRVKLCRWWRASAASPPIPLSRQVQQSMRRPASLPSIPKRRLLGHSCLKSVGCVKQGQTWGKRGSTGTR